MKYRLLGKSGLRVSEAALGTMTFGEDWGSSKDESQNIYETYREAGGNFIDTANVYTNGTSERFVGEFIHGHREGAVLATKYSNAAPSNDPNAAGNHRKSMMQAVEASLKRLQTDHIDLYWVHTWDGITPVEEVMRGLDDIVCSVLPPGTVVIQNISPRQGSLRRHLGRSRLVDSPGKYARGPSRLDAVHRVADRVQPG
jgi:aryl-alcohol dehydrogenase-like predicted oxidoreductase